MGHRPRVQEKRKKIYNEEQIKPWAATHGLDLDALNLGFRNAVRQSFFSVPGDAGRKAALARGIAGLYSGDTVLLWVFLTGVWDDRENEFLFQLLRRAVGEERSLWEAESHVFGPDDRDYLEAFMAVCIYFTWDFLVVSSSGELFVAFDNDSGLRVHGTNSSRVEGVYEFLDAMNIERM